MLRKDLDAGAPVLRHPALAEIRRQLGARQRLCGERRTQPLERSRQVGGVAFLQLGERRVRRRIVAAQGGKRRTEP